MVTKIFERETCCLNATTKTFMLCQSFCYPPLIIGWWLCIRYHGSVQLVEIAEILFFNLYPIWTLLQPHVCPVEIHFIKNTRVLDGFLKNLSACPGRLMIGFVKGLFTEEGNYSFHPIFVMETSIYFFFFVVLGTIA